MGKVEYEYNEPCKSKNVLNISSRIITEFIEKEYAKGESANNRANICICLIGIFAAIVISLSGYIFQNSKINIALLSQFLFLSIVIIIMVAIYHSIKVILVRQADTLSPDIINDIKNFAEIEALQYEIKWKLWEYNQLNDVNTKKLFNLHRTQRCILISSVLILFLGLLFYFNASIISFESECYFKCFELIAGCLIVLLSFFINPILEKHTFWKSQA